MAKTTPAPTPPPKLPRLPKGTKITKRPLLHPAIAAPRSGPRLPKAIYLSASSPFMSSVKRVRKYLAEIDARASGGKMDLLSGAAEDDGRRPPRVQRVGRGVEERRREEEVLVKGTGRAVAKALRVALHFQGEADCLVRLRTGSVGAVDDVVVRAGREDADANGEGEGEGEEVSETRVRRTSMLEVAISLR